MDLSKNIIVLSGVYADEFDIDIQINTRGKACTDGKTVWIPKPKPEYLAMTWGYCAHEAGHIRDSDIDLIIATKKANPFLGWLLNVVEDTRIEAVQVEYFPGVKKHFDELTLQVLKYDWESNKDKDLNELLVDYVFNYIRGFIPNYPIWDEDTVKLQEAMNRKFNLIFMYSFNQLLDKARFTKSTTEALDLSKEILTYLVKAADQEEKSDSESNQDQGGNSDESKDKSQPQNGSDSSNDDSNGDGPDSDASSTDDDNSEGETASTQSGEKPNQSDDGNSDGNSQSGIPDGNDSKDGKSSKGAGGQNVDSENNESLSKEATEAIKETIAKTQDQLGSGDLGDLLKDILSDSDNQLPLTTEEKYALGAVTEKSVNISQAKIDCAVDMASQTTSELRYGLVRLMEDKTRSQRVTGRKGRRLAKGKAHRLIVGDTRIFKRKFTERDEVNCDVAVLADYSSSMGSNIKSVQIASFALLDCLSKIDGANTCAYGFGGNGIVEIQKPNQRVDQLVKGRIFSLSSTGGTPATEAYWASIQAFRRMSGKKKVAIMVTDGEPNDQTSTFNMVQTMRKEGICVIALGVGVSQRAHSIFNGIYGANNWIYVQNFSDLPRELLNIAKEVI